MDIRSLVMAVALPLLAWSAAGGAAVFDFEETPSSVHTALSYTVDGIDVTVTAGSASGADARVFRGGKGLGVKTDLIDNPGLDGFREDEFLSFDFGSVDVALTHVVFENVDVAFFGPDETGLAIDGAFFGEGAIYQALDIAGATASCSRYKWWQPVGRCEVDLSLVHPAAVGTLFRFGDLGGNNLDAEDNFFISSLTVERIASVPEPAAVGLFLIGVAGAAAGLSRRR